MFKSFREFILSPRLFLVLTPIIFLSGSLFTDKVLFWGTPSLQFIPWQVQAYRTILSGDFPLWNPLNGMGSPLLANYQLAFFYPPSWILIIIYRFFDISGLAWGNSFLVMVHMVWAGIGMAKFAKVVGIKNEFGQVISGLAFSMGGYFAARVSFFSIIWTGAWLPWLMAFATANPSKGTTDKTINIPLVIIISMQLLAGHAQLAWYSLMLVFSWVFMNGFLAAGIKGVLQPIHKLVVVYLFAAALTSIQLIPTGELLINSQRSLSVDYETALSYSFWPWRILTLFSPNFFGNPGEGNYWGYANFWEDDFYIGLLPLLLALTTIKWILNKRTLSETGEKRSLLLYFWFVAAAGLILALGRNTTVFIFLFRYIPTFDLFNAPSRFLIWVAFSLSILAGFGLDAWKKPCGRSLFWFRLATAGCIGISIGALLTTLVIKDVEFTFINSMVYTGAIGFCTGLITLFISDKTYIINSKKMFWAATLLICFDLIFSSIKLFPLIENRFYSGRIKNTDLTSVILRDKRVFIRIEDENRLKYKRFFNFDSYLLAENWSNLRVISIPNINIIDNISMVNNFDPLQINRYAEWMSSISRIKPSNFPALLKIMNVGLFEFVHPRDIGIVRYSQISEGQPYKWYSCVKFVENGSLEDSIQNINAGYGLDKLIIEGKGLDIDKNCGENQPEISKVTETSRQLELKVTSKKSGWILFSRTWYPGWAIYINGHQADLARADHTFMAAEIPAGTVNIILTYRPVTFFLGLTITSFTILLFFFMIINPRQNTLNNRKE